MTPEELALVVADGAAIDAAPDRFAVAFYATLFEIAPDSRSLFPDDLTEQRGKLVDELRFLVDAAAGGAGAPDLDAFVERARGLGRRHAGYGVTRADYEPVRVALLTSLSSCAPGWDERHEEAWTKLYRLIAAVMHEGAAEAEVAP